MAITLELTRPEDLVSLKVRGENLRLDAIDRNAPALVVQDRQAPAYLILEFPPQTTAETAFFEANIVAPETGAPDPDAGKGARAGSRSGSPRTRRFRSRSRACSTGRNCSRA
jgi:hypothetical protein